MRFVRAKSGGRVIHREVNGCKTRCGMRIGRYRLLTSDPDTLDRMLKTNDPCTKCFGPGYKGRRVARWLSTFNTRMTSTGWYAHRIGERECGPYASEQDALVGAGAFFADEDDRAK